MSVSKEELQKYRFWSEPVPIVASLLQTDTGRGLTEDEAGRRLSVYGQNVIEKTRESSPFLIFADQFKSPLILILTFAGSVTMFISHYRDSLFIFAAVAINAILGFYQEYKAEKALAELRTYLKQRARVIRDGIEHEIDSANVVPGDLIRLEHGDRVPADCRLFFVNDFQVDEAVLTGESLPEFKSVGPVSPDAPLGDQNSMVFAGTFVVEGTASAIVCRTDFDTELGKIAKMVSGAKIEETPLQKAIKGFSVRMGIFLGLLTLLIFGVGIFSGYSAIEMFLTSVAIAVSAVPEGLPVAMTIILAVGVQRMARRKGVVRKLIAAEALGSATLIMTDKTGTLTLAKMELSQVLPFEGVDEKRLLELAIIDTNVLVENPKDDPLQWRTSGRMLESALVRAAATKGVFINDVRGKHTLLSFLPFNAANKFSVSLVRNHKDQLIFLGAPDALLKHSSLNDADKKVVLDRINALASSGELVVGVATKDVEPKEDFSFLKDLKLSGLTMMGLVTLRDPIRQGIREVMGQVERAGIRVVIATGDHRGTAESVAREVGMTIGQGSTIDSSEMDTLSDEELKKLLPSVRVISRVSPLNKVRIVKAFQETGEVVAMTGDGVNDAPSIKQADIGIAMGSGTEVARDVADLVLLDDNFETIVAAVEEGHQIRNNIRKVIVYLLSSSADSLFLIGGALLLGLALPLNALQILWVNFFSDSFPAVALAFEKDIDGPVSHPKKNRPGLFDPLMKFLIIFVGISTSAFLFILYWFLMNVGFDEALVKTFIYASFGSYSLLWTFSVRSLEKNIFQYPLLSNRFLVVGVILGLVLMGMSIYVPFLQSVLNTVALPLPWLLAVLLVGIINTGAVEFGKWIFHHNNKKIS